MRITILYLLIIMVSNLNAQTRNYDVVAFDDVIGEASISKKVISDSEYTLDYNFDAIVKVLFIKTTVLMNMKGKYENGFIKDIDVYYKTNDKEFFRNYEWNDSKYDVVTNDKESTLEKKAYFSVMNFYEKEPIGITEVFLEKQNEFVPLKVLGNHKYRVRVDGDDCTYTYKDGLMQELFVDGVVNLYVRLRK